MGLDFVLASTGGMGTAHKTLESQFRDSDSKDAFFIIEDLWVQIVINVN
ncbi:hypothetical protein AVEN_161986-1, partial [Araneus ventricosus]